MPDDLLRARQLAFAHHVRDPEAHPPPPGIEARRLQVYRDLFHGSLATLLGGSFPVIRRTLGDEPWRALVRAFYTGHRARTPLFTRIAGEFVDWLAGRDPATTGDPPWLAELAHYEWIELALQVQEDDPFVRPLAYAWPVHRIGPDYQPAEPPPAPTLLLARRDAAGDVHFSALSPLVFRLLQLLEADRQRPFEDVLAQLAGEAGRAGDPTFLAEGAAMLRRLMDEGIAPRALC